MAEHSHHEKDPHAHRPGSLVKLVSSSPEMTVWTSDRVKTDCIWYDETAREFRRITLPTVTLEIVCG